MIMSEQWRSKGGWGEQALGPRRHLLGGCTLLIKN